MPNGGRRPSPRDAARVRAPAGCRPPFLTLHAVSRSVHSTPRTTTTVAVSRVQARALHVWQGIGGRGFVRRRTPSPHLRVGQRLRAVASPPPRPPSGEGGRRPAGRSTVTTDDDGVDD